MKFTITAEGRDIEIETPFWISGNSADLLWLGKKIARRGDAAENSFTAMEIATDEDREKMRIADQEANEAYILAEADRIRNRRAG